MRYLLTVMFTGGAVAALAVWCRMRSQPGVVMPAVARQLERSGRTAAASAVYAALAMHSPHNAIALDELHHAAADGRALGAVIEALRLVTEAVPTDARAWYDLGVGLRATGDEVAAESAFRRVLEVDPVSGWAERARGCLTSRAE